jgi:hypothetical protein
MRFALVLIACLLVNLDLSAADWQSVTTELLQKEKPGYGGLCGVAVDPTTGELFVDVSDRGIFRSSDQGKNWERLGLAPIKGRTETPGCLQLDPTGKTKRFVTALVYGAPIAVGTSDKGDWRFLDKKSEHVDWCAVDWSDPEMKFILTLKHESGGLLLRSRDGGKSFEEVGKGYGPAWVFDADTAVVTLAKSKERPKGSLVRTVDGGKTFMPCGDYGPICLPRWHESALYWLADNALIKTTTKGETWEKVCELKDGRFGPVFGKDAKQIFVLTGAGIVESTDGGLTWTKPIPIPPELKGVSPLTWMAYDPKNDVLYVMKMTSELYKLSKR